MSSGVVGFIRLLDNERRWSERQNKPVDARWESLKNYAIRHLIPVASKYDDIYEVKIKEWAAIEGLLKMLESKSKL